MPGQGAPEGRGKSLGWELCSSSPSSQERFHCVIPTWPSGRAQSLPHLSVGLGLGRHCMLLGRPQPLRRLLQLGASARCTAEGCSVSGGFCTLSVLPPRRWEGAAAPQGHGAVGTGRCWVSVSVKALVWWFLGACTCDMGNTSCPILPLWAWASSPFLAGAHTERGSAAA